eukprot:Skav236010  [mRNA]  locus=C9050778:276:773:+ [translate_table: standard]
MDINYILRCTDKWTSPKLADGRLGCIYKAEDGESTFCVFRVSDKRILNQISNEADVQDLAKIAHPSIASLRGYIFTPNVSDFAIFAYEFGCGNVRMHLDDKSLAGELLWKSRVDIVQGILRALHYLHTNLQVYHRLVQPAYIFLTPAGFIRGRSPLAAPIFSDEF